MTCIVCKNQDRHHSGELPYYGGFGGFPSQPSPYYGGFGGFPSQPSPLSQLLAQGQANGFPILVNKRHLDQ